MLLPAAIANSRWFLTTMGTGTVAVLLHQLPYQFNGLQYISLIFFSLNIIIFLALLLLSVVRYAVWPEITMLMLRHPVQSLFMYSPSPHSQHFEISSGCQEWLLGSKDIADRRGAMPMGLGTIITMLIYVAVPLSDGFVYFVQVLFWIDVAIAILCCLAIPMLMYPLPPFPPNP
jgi:tellurite resistance protein TehA-like permease